MSSSIAKLAEHVLPGFVVKALRNLLVNARFAGDYASFKEALEAAGGVGLADNPTYVEKAFKSRPSPEALRFCDTLRLGVLAGFLMPIAGRSSKDSLHVLDFGGGPGVHYFLMRELLPQTLSLQWDIFETPLMADQGRKTYAGEPLRFYSEWQDILSKRYDVILASNTIHLFEDPYQVIDRLTSIESRYLIAQDVPVIDGEKDRLTILMPPPIRLYSAYRKENFPRFPAWFFSEDKLLKRFAQGYTIRTRWYSGNTAWLDGKPVARKSYLLEKE